MILVMNEKCLKIRPMCDVYLCTVKTSFAACSPTNTNFNNGLKDCIVSRRLENTIVGWRFYLSILFICLQI